MWYYFNKRLLRIFLLLKPKTKVSMLKNQYEYKMKSRMR